MQGAGVTIRFSEVLMVGRNAYGYDAANWGSLTA